MSEWQNVNCYFFHRKALCWRLQWSMVQVCTLGVVQQRHKLRFCWCFKRCLQKGQSKGNNIMVTDTTNCGKSFLLNPLDVRMFHQPCSWKICMGWSANMWNLNDLCWSEELIRQSDLLLLLEGQTVHFLQPRNQFTSNLVIERENSLSFFAASKTSICWEMQLLWRNGDRNDEL